MRPRVAVVGGGISGLVAAHTVAERAPRIDVVLLEAGKRVGGVVQTIERDGFLIESAADNFLTTPPHAIDLCRRLHLEETR
jgi:oxygen-dependent protoporphyrinogen oxidase